MVTPRSFLLLAAVLTVAAAASSHVPNRWGLPSQMTQTQKPPQTTQKPPAMEAQPAQNATGAGDMQEIMSQMAAIMVPKIQAKLRVLLGNIGRAITGSVFATFRTGCKTPLAAMFVPLDKMVATPELPVNDLESYPPGYAGDEEALRMQEPSEQEDDQVTERKLR